MADALLSTPPTISPSTPTDPPLFHHPQLAFRLSLSKPSYRTFTLRSTATPSSSSHRFRSGDRSDFFRGKPPNPDRTLLRSRPSFSIPAQMKTGIIGIGKAQRWWEKGIQPNMIEVMGAQHLVDSLLNAGDKLVVVDFYSPGCGGCKALHPKICQLAGMNPDVLFLQVNYETHKSMCYSLNVHVLPFFRFYRGSHGRLCSFSCTNATIKKFKDALAKYGADFCSLQPAKGLEEKELRALAANKDLSFNYKSKPEPPVVTPEEEKILSTTAHSGRPVPLPSSTTLHLEPNPENRTLIPSRG